MGIASIPKLKGKSNYEEWRNAMQGFCKMNGYWRYMLGQIPKPAPPPKDATPVIQEAFDTKLMKWLTITDSLCGAIQTTCMIDPMSHVGDMELPSDMWKKFESLYRDTGFIERDSIFIRLSTQTLSDFADVAEFADNIKRNSTRLKEIGTTDVPNWMYTTWLLNGLDSDYDSFRMMLTNNRKADQAKGIKTEPDFDSILEQILNLDTQKKKVSESRSMKSASKATETKKSTGPSHPPCPYCNKGGHIEEKCYYKYPEQASQSFRDRFKDRIADLKSKNQGSTREAHDQDHLSLDNRNRGWMVRQPSPSALSTGSHDTSWYFDNAASYHMSYDLTDFEDPAHLQPCISPQDDITLADGSVILPDGIGKVWFDFEVNGQTDRIFLSGVRYCTKLDTKLISLGMLDRKGLTYSASKGCLTVKDGNRAIMTGQLDTHNLYRVNTGNSILVTIPPTCAITAATSPSPTDLTTWHRRFAHLNGTYLKRLPDMTSGMKILAGAEDLSACTVCVQAKMTRQPHRDPHIPSEIPGFRIHLDVGGSANVYATWKGYRYFALLVDDATRVTWVRFMKKKSDVLSVFKDFVVLLERHYGIRVCILHTDFGEFNSDAAAEYFSHTGILWEPSAPNAQQQNGVVERHMRTVVEGARAQMLDANLPLKLWAESINTMVYIKNRSPTSALYEGTITPIQDFHRGNPPRVDHIRIFGSEAYVFDESATRPGLTSKSWTGYLVGYDGRNQYRIYDPSRHSVFVRRDVHFNERVVGPARPILTVDNSFGGETTDKTLIFPSLPSETKDSTKFTYADTNPTLAPVSDTHATSPPPQLANNPNSTMSELAIFLPDTDTAETRENEINAISNNTAYNQPQKDTPAPSNRIPVVSNPTTTAHNKLSNTTTVSSNITSNIPGTFDDSDDSLSDAPPSSTQEDPETAAPRRSTRSGANQVDYKKFFQRGKAAAVKTNSSVPLSSPHSEASRVLFDYALNHSEEQSTRGFVRVARKKAKGSTPDMPSLKDALRSAEADAWKEAMKVEYEALLANGTWVLVDRPKHQHVLTGKWAFKRKRDINGNIKKYKARWVGRGFQQQEGIDYFQTYASVVKAATNKALFAVTAKNRLHSHQCDAITAFLNSQLWEEVYIEQPEFFHNGNYSQVLMLLKALYGLKQSARLWFDTFADEMKELGFFQSHYDHALYLNYEGTYVAVYVDDLQIVGPDLKIIEKLKADLASRFKMTDLGPTAHYLGMEVTRTDTSITITQTVYIDQLLAGHQMSNCNAASTPMVEGLSLLPAAEGFTPHDTDVTAYKRFTGSAQWLACQTRPDIIQAVAKLSKHNVKPTDQCWTAVVHLLRYLKGTRTRGLRFGSGDLNLYGYSDSSWADDISDRRSTAGYIFMLNNGPISWASRKQPTVSTSTCEAEYIAQYEAACEAVWLRGLLGEIGVYKTVNEDGYPRTIAPPTLIHADNQGAIKLTENPEYHRKTKHIPIKYHKTRELVDDGTIQFKWIPTSEMVADGLTKSLGANKFREFVSMLGLIDR